MITNINFPTQNIVKTTSSTSNPISFKGNFQKSDSVELSTEAKAKNYILTLEKEKDELNKQKRDIESQYEEANLPQEVNQQLLYINCRIREIEKQISNIKHFPNFVLVYNSRTWEKDSVCERVETLKKLGCVLDIRHAPEYDNISPKAKQIIIKNCDRYTSCVLNTKANADFLSKFIGYSVISASELKEDYGVENVASIFPEYVKSDEYIQHGLLLFPIDSPESQIISDLTNEKVATAQHLSSGKSNFDIMSLPLAYKKYSKDNETSKMDYTFIDLEDKNVAKIMSYKPSAMKYVSQMPFKLEETPYGNFININDEYNKKILETIHNIYPEDSKYFIKHTREKDGTTNIPVSYLEQLGFASKDALVKLIQTGKLVGKTNDEGEYFVTFSIYQQGGLDKSLITLNKLINQNPKIATFQEFKLGLEIDDKRLEYAIFTGEVEIIEECINTPHKEARYINITTPKNQEFIRKIRFEKALEQTIKNLTRLENQKTKIEKQDLKQRLSGVRMALVWEFMPNTKAIGSMLAKKDGYISILLAKEADPEETLTNKEEAKINSYRKEMWLLAGTDELHQAYKKAGKIMKTFKEEGLDAVDEEYLPIFERYGFTK